MAYIVDAILALDAKAKVKVVSEDYDKITWFDNNPNKITVDQIKTKKAELDKIDEANELNAKVVLDNNQPISIKILVSLIDNAKFIIANDTGPAHIASHLNKQGFVLFGSHTTAKKVSIENHNFKAISVENLNNLTVETVLEKVKSKLN